jgi:uncharacterized membrane protein YoaK (UPF0700 family)
VLLLTLAAGCTDVLSFLDLDKVFSSFVTGDILFIGISLAQDNSALLVRAVVAVVIFLAGVTLGSLYLGRGPADQSPWEFRGTIARYLVVEGLVMLAFAILWQLTGNPATHPTTQVVLLGIAAFGMGLQGALVTAANLPNVVSVALTGTELLLGKRLAQGIGGQAPDKQGRTSTPFLVALLLSYTLAALVVTLAMPWVSTQFIPFLLVALGIVVVLLTREPEVVPVSSRPGG